MSWLDAAYGTGNQAASDGSFYDPAKLQALLGQINPGADGRKVLGNDAWMQLLNPIGGLKLVDPGAPASTRETMQGTEEVAARPATYKDAQGRSYKDVGGGNIQYFDNSGGGWQNPTGNGGDRLQPTYRLGADGTATPVQSGANYQASGWVNTGRPVAKLAATAAAAYFGGVGLEGLGGAGASAAGAAGAGGMSSADLAALYGAEGYGAGAGGYGGVIAGNAAGTSLGVGAGNSAAAQMGLSLGSQAGAAGEAAAAGGGLSSADAAALYGNAGYGATSAADAGFAGAGATTAGGSSPNFLSALGAGNMGDAAGYAGNAVGNYLTSPSGVQSVVGLAGSYLSSQQQANAAKDASANAMAMYNQTRQDNAPWRAQGGNAVNQLGDLLGTSGNTGASGYGSLTHQFGAADLNSNLAPNYQFQLQQGLGATQNAANASGFSGNALKGINDYAQNYAGNAYQQAFNNYTANQTNTYNRLSNLAGLGQTANQTTATSGTANTANANNYLTGGAAAGAAGIVGGANAINNGIGNYQGWNYLNDPARQP